MYVNSSRRIPVAPGPLFEFLSDLENHWLLADGAISVVHVEPGDGGRVRMRGPLGVRRTAVTSLERLDPPRVIAGTAEVGSRTRAHVIWELEPDGGGTRVTLAARVDRAAPLDRLLLAAGGRAWLESRFQLILATLEERFKQ